MFHYKTVDWNNETPSLPPDSETLASPVQGWEFAIPDWMIIGLAVVLPWRWFVLAKRHRNRPGFCGQCGYDLRATPDRCPECGAALEKVSEIST
jgi:hypothetical protein